MRTLALAVLAALSAAPARADGAKKPLNVLIIGADTLRADHLDLYGYKLPTSPNLDRWAAKGVVFDRAYSQGSWTLPSFGSVFTSRYPEQHGATTKNIGLRPTETMLAQLFAKAGYRTAGFTGGPNVAEPYGFGKGYDYYLGGDRPRRLDAYVPVALDWIAADRSKPFFLFLQPQDVHPPFDIWELPPSERNRWDPGYKGDVERYVGSFFFFRAFNGEPYDHNFPVPSEELKAKLAALAKDPAARRHVASIYDDRVAHLDATFGAFMDELERRGVLKDTIVVLLSDHGTLLGEGGKWVHSFTLSTHDGVFHVALAVWAPGAKPRRVPQAVELVDVAPTLAAMAGLPASKTFEGRDLSGVVAGSAEAPERPVFGVATLANDKPSRMRHWVRDGRWQLTLTEPGGKTALHDESADPDELTDVSAAHPEELKRLSGELARHLQKLARAE